MSLIVSFAQALRLRRKRCQPKRSLSLTRNCGRLDETRVYGLTPQRRFALEGRRGNHEDRIPAVCGLLKQFVESSRQSLTHWDGRFAGFGLSPRGVRVVLMGWTEHHIRNS
jgi:hypothetical protein